LGAEAGAAAAAGASFFWPQPTTNTVAATTAANFKYERLETADIANPGLKMMEEKEIPGKIPPDYRCDFRARKERKTTQKPT
jgi:hypothetical protein